MGMITITDEELTKATEEILKDLRRKIVYLVFMETEPSGDYVLGMMENVSLGKEEDNFLASLLREIEPKVRQRLIEKVRLAVMAELRKK